MICGFAYFSLVNRLLLFGARAGEPRTAAAFRPWYIFFNFRLAHMEIPRMWMDVDCGWCQCKLTDAQRTLVASVCEREWGIFDVCALHWMRERVDAKCDRTHYTTIYTLMAVTSSLFVLLWSVLNWPSRRHTYLHVHTHTHARTIGKHTISVRRFRSIFANSIAFPFSIAIAATRVSLSSCSWPMLPISFARFAIVHRSMCVADFLAQKPIYFDSLANTCFDVQSIISHDPHARRRERNKWNEK